MRRITDAGVQEFERAHIAAVRQVAPECVVLLKSNGHFPLGTAGKIAVFGDGVRRTVKGGTGSGDVLVRHFTTVEEGIEAAGFTITSKAWLDAYDALMDSARRQWLGGLKAEAKAKGENSIFYCIGKVMPEPEYSFSLDCEGDTAIYVLTRNSGEGFDRTTDAGDICLTATEIRDILALNEKYERFMLVLNVCGMVDLTPVSRVDNILLLSQLGTPTGDVLADLLLGKSYPSGKLTMTWAPIDTYPSTAGFGRKDDTYYKEGVYVGYRYFDTVGASVTYPFGYGLGYTTFTVTPAEVTADEKTVAVKANVTNTGAFPGKETVQVYVSASSGKLDQPYQKLAGYVKTPELAAGETTEVIVKFDTTILASFCEDDSAYMMEAGEYIIRVGNSSRATDVAAVLTLGETVVTERTKHICPGWGFDDEVPQSRACSEDTSGAVKIALDASKFETKTHTYPDDPETIGAGEPFDFREVIAGNKSVEQFIAGLTDTQLANLAVGNYKEGAANPLTAIGDACIHIAGAAGETTGLLADVGVEGLYMADGPAGLRLSPEYRMIHGDAKESDSNRGRLIKRFNLDEEEQKVLAMLVPPPGDEVLKLPLNYQYCTAIPIGTAIAQSWNTETAAICADVVGEEMELFGVHIWLAPAQNIQRSPLCGRNFEYFSEDPLLSGTISAAIVKGVQKHHGCGVTIKHFACNNQETNRIFSNSAVSERALREIYLKSFEYCVKDAAPKAIMSSYNLVNGEHTCNSRDLLTHVLRDEWGFEGLVMTDWSVTGEIGSGREKRENKYGLASAAGCVKAGNHVTMPGTSYDREDILKALEDPEHPYALTRARLQLNAKKVLEEVIKLRYEKI